MRAFQIEEGKREVANAVAAFPKSLQRELFAPRGQHCSAT